MAQRNDAALRSCSTNPGAGCIEVNGMTFGTGHGAGWHVALGRRLAGDESQCAECGNAEEDGADEFRFHGYVWLCVLADGLTAFTSINSVRRQNPRPSQFPRTTDQAALKRRSSSMHP